MGDMKKEAYNKSIWILEKCSTPNGFFAAFPGYDMIFARDAMIIALGASLIDDNKKLKNTFKNSLLTLAKNQSSHGQIPNAVDKYVKGRRQHVDYQSIDSTMWFILGNYIYKKIYKDSSLLRKHKKQIELGLTWLGCQETKENGMLTQLPTTDWQDAFPHRYGFTIHSQVLYYQVMKTLGMNRKAEEFKKIVNHDKDSGLWDSRGYYLPWRWKNHGEYQEKGEWFDTLGNVLAIVTGLADKSQSEKILNYIKKHKINKPYPMKASVWPPIRSGSKDWQDYFKDNDARIPYHYINSGIWTYVGGFYVCALVKMKKFREAEKQLQKLAEANMKNDGNFAEWLHGQTGEIGDEEKENKSYQGWNAAMYIAAYESVKKKKCLIF